MMLNSYSKELDADLIALLFEKAPDVMFLYDSEGNLIDGNEEAEKITGYSRKELRGKNILNINLLIPDDIPKAAENIKEIIKGKKTQSNIYTITRKDGSLAYVETRAYPIKNQDKTMILAIGRDITERKKIESELLKKRGEYKKLIDQASDAIGILAQDEIIYVNNALAKLVGYEKAEELIGLPIQPFYHEDYSELMKKYTQARRVGQYAPPRYQMKILNRYNEPIDVDVQVTIIEWEGELAALTILRDITQQKLFETRKAGIYNLSARLGSSNTIKEIAEKTTEIIDQILSYKIVTFHALENDKLVNIGSEGFCPTKQPIDINAKSIIAKAAKLKTTINVPDVSKDPDYFAGSGVEIKSELAVPIVSGETVHGVINIESGKYDFYKKEDELLLELLCQHVASAIDRVKNDSERKLVQKKLIESQVRIEQEKEMNQIKTRFMSTATHEIRTPLTSVQGYLELLKEEDMNLTETQKAYCEIIDRNVQRLEKITGDLINVQRIDERRMHLTVEKVNIRDVIDDVIMEFTPILRQKNQHIICGDTDATCSLDRFRVMQVIINLLSNASKFSPENGQIYLNASVSSNMVWISVTDMGKGISKKDLPKLFKPFPDIKVEGNGSGTGLGLVISKGIIELHGGKIWAESDGVGRGTTMTFTLPISD